MAKTWLITGSSRGFGWELTKAVLDSGDRAVATARRLEQLDDLGREYGDRISRTARSGVRAGPVRVRAIPARAVPSDQR